MKLHEPPPPHRPDGILPMINVVFLLLIFFVINGALHATDFFAVDPPLSESGEQVQDEETTVLIGAGGRLALQDREVDDVDMQLAVSDRLAENRDAVIRVKADAETDTLRVIEVMELLRDVGVARVVLMTQGPPS